MTDLRLYMFQCGSLKCKLHNIKMNQGLGGRFPEALHIVQRAEYEYAFTPDWFASGGYIRKDFDRPGLPWHFSGRNRDGSL